MGLFFVLDLHVLAKDSTVLPGKELCVLGLIRFLGIAGRRTVFLIDSSTVLEKNCEVLIGFSAMLDRY